MTLWLQALGRQSQKPHECPIWPPDLFAISGALLKRSGAYLQLFDRRGARNPPYAKAHEAGREWRVRLDKLNNMSVPTMRKTVPALVTAAWRRILKGAGTAISDLRDHPQMTHDLLTLAFAADEACGGLGVSNPDTPFLATTQAILEANKLTSFTWDVPHDTICVLGKQHTPQRGATFRSLTHHLAMYWPNDIEGRWIGPYGRGINDKAANTINLLLLPWPESVATDDFQLAQDVRAPRKVNSSYFDYRPAREPTSSQFRKKFLGAIVDARRHAKHLDAVVLPECAVSLVQYWEAEEVALREGIMLISGVRIPLDRGRSVNVCAIQPAGLLCPANLRKSTKVTDRKFREAFLQQFRLFQSKHHRWCLDAGQVQQYQLTGTLPIAPDGATWENIHLPKRALHFVTLGWWMTWSVLICEDLARQDPAADLIRAVGPNLLIALLMDGPQLRGRWPARYASVLSEDPGTSVLTLTSLGMADRCRPVLSTTRQRAPVSRAIALWKDSQKGEHEIVLDGRDNACVLSLVCSSATEYAADGRGDNQEAHTPIYAGYKSFETGVDARS